MSYKHTARTQNTPTQKRHTNKNPQNPINLQQHQYRQHTYSQYHIRQYSPIRIRPYTHHTPYTCHSRISPHSPYITYTHLRNPHYVPQAPYMSLAPHYTIAARLCPYTEARPLPLVRHLSMTTVTVLRHAPWLPYDSCSYETHPCRGAGGAIMSISRTISIISISIIQKNNLYCWRKVKCYIDLKTPAPEALLSERTS